jgi:hypothetical protein
MGIDFIGEDAFGNVLILLNETVQIIDHEEFSLTNTYIELEEFKKTIISDGYFWVDCYTNEDLEIFNHYQQKLPIESHIHWIQPLFLGGNKELNNTVTLERLIHWKGHFELQKQIKGLDAGDWVIIK